MEDAPEHPSEQASAPEVVTEIPVSVIRSHPRRERTVEGFSSRAVENTVAAGLAGIRIAAKATGVLARRVLRTPPVQFAGQVANEVAVAVAEELAPESDRVVRRLEDQIAKIVAAVVPVVVDAIDPVDIVDRLDLDAVLDRLDLDAILDRVDVNHLLDRVDVNHLLDRVDVNRLLDRVDVDRLMERVDVDAVMERVEVGGIVTKGTGQVAGSALDLARRQAVGLDVVVSRSIDRLLGRDPDRMPAGPAGLVLDGPEADGEAEPS